MAKAYSPLRACTFCGSPFRPDARTQKRENYVCPSVECQAKLKLYKRLLTSHKALLEFIKNLELKVGENE